jgi:nucleoid-associated protein YgaU
VALTPTTSLEAADQKLVRARLEVISPPRDDPIIPLRFNPAEYQLKKTQTFAEIEIPGLTSPPLQWVRGGAETLTFDALADTTDSLKDVDVEYVAKVRSLLDLDEKLHAPPIVAFSWGARRVKGVLDGLGVSYSLFREDGVPLRAKLSLTIKEYRPVAVQIREERRTSPDVAKLYPVVANDTLTGIASKVYKDPSQWRVLAAANGIRDPRALRPGLRLIIPRLR